MINWTFLAQIMGSSTPSHVQYFQRNWMDLSSQTPVSGEKKNTFCWVSRNRGFVCFWGSFPSSCIHSKLPTVLDTCRTRKIVSDVRHWNTEHYHLPAYLSFLQLTNHNSVLNDSVCHSLWQATKVTYVQISKSLSPKCKAHQQIPAQKGGGKALLEKDRRVKVRRYLWRSSSPTSPAQKARLTRAGCTRSCLSVFWVSPRMETPQFLWITFSSAQSVKLQ